MIRERIADDIYIFTSRRYAQVTAGAILTKDGVVLIDTLFFPEESLAVREFLENRLGYQIRYVINTHYHADHTQGTSLFPEAEVIGHARCRELLDTVGREGLARSKAQSSEFDAVELVLPDLVFDNGTVDLFIGGKTLTLYHMPGHSPDLIGVMVNEERIFFASDTMMPVPTFFDGRFGELVQSLHYLQSLEPDTVVQGHGEVVLRGEINTLIQSNLAYLACVQKKVASVVKKGQPASALESISIESCGKSRIPLNGFVAQLHQANLDRMYEELVAEQAAA